MELPDNPEQFIADSQLRRAEIQNQLARLATEHENLLADELAIKFEVSRRRTSGEDMQNL